MYEEAKESKKRKKAAKAAMYDAAPTQPPQEEILVAGPRKVTREVDQNRGLTPHRRKDMKNPRVKVTTILNWSVKLYEHQGMCKALGASISAELLN